MVGHSQKCLAVLRGGAIVVCFDGAAAFISVSLGVVRAVAVVDYLLCFCCYRCQWRWARFLVAAVLALDVAAVLALNVAACFVASF